MSFRLRVAAASKRRSFCDEIAHVLREWALFWERVSVIWRLVCNVMPRFPINRFRTFHRPRHSVTRGESCAEIWGGVQVIALEGRLHFYEGYCAEQVTLPVFVMRHLGVELLIASNASGGLNPRYGPGDLMALADHINLMGQRTASLSLGAPLPSRSGNSSLYDPILIDTAQEIARREGFVCHRGTYVAVVGPNYETRAEYRAMRRLGGDAVGMSTIPEVLAARSCGMRVLALSTITNIARPDAPTATKPQEVVEIAATAEPNLCQIVLGILQRCFNRSDSQSKTIPRESLHDCSDCS